jgi:tripartite-type tricarboxylate transporter receptor subunit TctC
MDTSAFGHFGTAHGAQHPTRRTLLGSLAVLGAVNTIGSLPAFAQQDYPNRPIRLITPYEAGTITDQVARAVGQAIAPRLKQPVVIENRVGAGGLIGAAAAATAAPDGYTLLMGTNGTHAINPFLHAKLPYDAIKSFTPVSLIGSGYSLLVVHPSVEAKSVAELIALAKAKPNQLRFGSGGIGTTPHLAGELFKQMSGVQIEHVAYKSSTHSTLDLLEGRVQMIFANVAAVGAHVKAGKLRVLGVTTPQRVPDYADVPTISESGLPGFAAELWLGLFVPAGVPPQIVDLLNQAVRSELANEEIARNFARQGFLIKTSTSQAFGTYVREEMTKWGAVVRASGAKPE